MGVPVDLTELEKLQDEVAEAVKKGIDTDKYRLEIVLNKHVKMQSILYSNQNRKVILSIEGQSVDVYSKMDGEDIEVVLERSRYATRYFMGAKYHELRKYFI